MCVFIFTNYSITMPSGILQLHSIGKQDVYLTQNPEINIFKYMYYRNVNFASDTVKLHMNEDIDFGKRASVMIPRYAHLLSKLYLHIKLPPLVRNGGEYASYCDTLGYAIFDETLGIELSIGGVIVDRLHPRQMDMWDDLHKQTDQHGYNSMILKGDNYRSVMHNAEEPVDLIIPLRFWFTEEYNQSLPLYAMGDQQIMINFKFKPFESLVNFDSMTSPDPVHVTACNAYAEYIYLDSTVIPDMTSTELKYLITQTQAHPREILAQDCRVFNSHLKFYNPVKELLFACVSKDSVDANNHYIYSKIESMSLLLDGNRRLDDIPEVLLRTLYPNNAHSTVPSRYFYTVPFCTKAETNQPTGTLNMSTFTDTVLNLTLPVTSPEMYLYVYAVSYNMLIFRNGKVELQWIS